MHYLSTRSESKRITGAEAIVRGQAADGGLYVPESFPEYSLEAINNLVPMSYSNRAAKIVGKYLTDFSENELLDYAIAAYEPEIKNADVPESLAPLHKLDVTTRFLELWHGPTCAFKDMALQLMPHLLTASLIKTGETRTACILVATSGDTGKAALEGFSNVRGTKIMVFYPEKGVSDVQKLQMTTQTGDNVNVTAVEGNFDDAQTGVKTLFSDKDLENDLKRQNHFLSSANSINWGRLVPQIAYYFSAYCDLLKNKEITLGDKINFCVPTGNFGNILSAYYAMRMGLPINKIICASNRNDVLTQFINTGTYDKNRPFYATASPSMDILVSSNLERLLYELSCRDGSAVERYMSALSEKGSYQVPDSVHKELNDVFACGYCSEEDTMKTINETFDKNSYLIDTHTAVAYKVLNEYRNMTKDETISVVVSTASPFKFCDAVLSALGKPYAGTGAMLLQALAEATDQPIPEPLADLKSKKTRFSDAVPISGMKSAVASFITGG